MIESGGDHKFMRLWLFRMHFLCLSAASRLDNKITISRFSRLEFPSTRKFLQMQNSSDSGVHIVLSIEWNRLVRCKRTSIKLTGNVWSFLYCFWYCNESKKNIAKKNSYNVCLFYALFKVIIKSRLFSVFVFIFCSSLNSFVCSVVYESHFLLKKNTGSLQANCTTRWFNCPPESLLPSATLKSLQQSHNDFRRTFYRFWLRCAFRFPTTKWTFWKRFFVRRFQQLKVN